MTKLLKKHNVVIQRAATKYKHTCTNFVEDINKELAKQLFKSIGSYGHKLLTLFGVKIWIGYMDL